MRYRAARLSGRVRKRGMRRADGVFAEGDAREELSIHASTGRPGPQINNAEARREERSEPDAPRRRVELGGDGRGDEL